MFVILAFAAAVSGAQDSGATTPTASTATKVANSRDNPDRVICKSEAVTGSHFVKRICMTKAEMDERDRQLEVFERERDHASGYTAPQTNPMGGQ